jgi:pyruvate ferredoxin oxidoreductase gamma subunit
MFGVRIHGRGGQGVVAAGELLALAGFLEGRHAQSFPSFGSERMGAPVTAFCRLDDKTIRLREPVLEPDALIIEDPTLLHEVDLFSGLHAGGYMLLNSTTGLEALGLANFARSFDLSRLRTVPATEIALKHVGRAVPNVPLLGAFAALTGRIRLDSVVAAIRQRFPPAAAAQNVAAAHEAFDAARRTQRCSHA